MTFTPKNNGNAGAEHLPVDNLRDALPHLRRPFTPAAMKFKVQAQWPKDNPTGGLIVSYIDARLVMERLNMVIPDWHDSYAFYGDRPDSGLIVCYLTVGGVTREDVGDGKGKAGYSDAFKRAGVKFGIGTVCYALARVTLDVNEKPNPSLKVSGRGAKKHLQITDAGDKRLRDSYGKWLESELNTFGTVLDHGDVADSVGPALDEAGAAPEPAEAEQGDLLLSARRAEVEALYQREIVEANGKRSKFPKGRFNAQMKEADSLEVLDEIADRIKQVAA